jgi:hypothetical protein
MPASFRRLPLVAAALAAAALVAAGSGTARTDVLPTLYVAYGMNCTFTITDDNHQPVTSIAPGTYQILISTPVSFASVDLAGIYDMTACKGSADFQLTGPGVSLDDTLDNGDSDHEQDGATLLPSSTYVATDANQPSVARYTITTLASGTPITPTTTTTSAPPGKTTTTGGTTGKTGTTSGPDPFRGTLTGSVGATGSISLLSKGRAIATLVAGRYAITVTDRSRKGGFVIQQASKAATTITTGGFVGKKTATLDLKPGQWLFYPTIVAKKSFFIVISPPTD